MPYEKFSGFNSIWSPSTVKAESIVGGYITAQELVLAGDRGILRSQNFVSGTSGWLIDGVGNAEFNNVTIRGEIVGPTSGGYTMYFGATGWRIEHSGGSIPFSGGPDSSGNFVLFGDGTANEFDIYNFSSGMYIGPSDNAVPQMVGIVIEHNGTPSASDTSILVRGDKFGTPVVLFQLDGDGRAKFHAGSVASPSISFVSDADTGFYWDSSGVMAYASNATFKMLFGANVIRGEGSTGAFWIPYAVGTAAAPTYSFFGDSDTGMYSYGANALGFATGGTFAFRIDANQNMIGNTMAIVGVNYIRTANGSAGAPAYQFTNDTDTGIYLSSAGNLAFAAAGTLGFTMNSGTLWANSNSGSLSTSTPRVVMSHADNYLLMSRESTASLFLMRQTTDGRVAEFYRTTTLVGSIAVTTTGTNFNQTSDYRLKENISDLTGSLDLIRQMRPVWFTWKDHPYEGITGGFIAHELQGVYPGAVTGEKDAINDEGDIDPQGVDHSKLVPLLVAAVQTLTDRIEALEKTVAKCNCSD